MGPCSGISIKRKEVSAVFCYSELEMRKYVKAEATLTECLNMSLNAQPATPISKAGRRSTTTGCQST